MNSIKQAMGYLSRIADAQERQAAALEAMAAIPADQQEQPGDPEARPMLDLAGMPID